MSYYRIQGYTASELLTGEQTSMDLGWNNNPSLVELDGIPTGEDDDDAHLGALLIHPTRIINVTPVDDTDFYTMVADYLDTAP